MSDEGHNYFFTVPVLPWREYDELGRIKTSKTLPKGQEDLTGRRFGRLIVIEFAGKNDYGNYVWKCRCDCGNEKIIYKGNLLKNPGGTKSCGCLQKEIISKRQRKNYNDGIINVLFGEYKKSARKRNLKFELSREEFIEMTSSSCYYCGALPSKIRTVKGCIGKYIYNGIDRINNLEGYIHGNCVPCCLKCNSSKRTQTKEEFLSWILSIYNKHLK